MECSGIYLCNCLSIDPFESIHLPCTDTILIFRNWNFNSSYSVNTTDQKHMTKSSTSLWRVSLMVSFRFIFSKQQRTRIFGRSCNEAQMLECIIVQSEKTISVCLSIDLSVFLSVYLSSHLSIYLIYPAGLSLSLSSNYLSIYLPTCLSISPFHLSSCLPVYLCCSVIQCNVVWCSVI